MGAKQILLVILLLAPAARAEELPALSQYLGRQIDGLEAAALPLRRDGAGLDQPAGLVLADINVELAPYAEFSLYGLAGLTISPEIDLVFTPPAQN